MKNRVLCVLLVACLITLVFPTSASASFTIVDGTVQGTVVDIETQEPIGVEAMLTLYAKNDMDTAIGSTTSSASDGTFTLPLCDGIVEGDYVLVVSQALYLSRIIELNSLTEEGLAVSEPIGLISAGRTSGKVMDAYTGVALNGVAVNVYQDEILITSTKTGADGKYSIETQSGVYDFIFMLDGYAVRTIENIFLGAIASTNDIYLIGNSHELNIIESGTCGDSLLWALDNNGLLTIEGSGAMDRWSGSFSKGSTTHYKKVGNKQVECSEVPWVNARENIVSIFIGEGVTSIGGCAFMGCTNLCSIIFPNTLSFIDGSSFAGCSSLTNISIPFGVEKIGDRAFWYCTSLEKISFPGSVTEIGFNAFDHCNLLTSVGPSGGDYDIEFNNIKVISHQMFSYCTGLMYVILPECVTSIEGEAFFNCPKLQSIFIPKNVKTINTSKCYSGGKTWYEGCVKYCNSLTDIYYAGTEEEWNSISDDWGAFSATQHFSTATIHFNSTHDFYAPWIIANKVTFSGHTYQLIWSKYGWDDMEAYCESVNGHLACITSAEEDDFLYKYIRKNGINNAVFGFTDDRHEGEWVWVSGEPTIYVNWAPGEANNEYGDEHWAHYYEKYPTGQWNDCQYPGSCYYLIEWDYNDSIRFDHNSYTLAAGDELILVAYVPTASGLTQNDFTYTSSDESVVSIVESGALIADNASAVVTIHANAVGTSTITVSTTDGRSASCEVTVTDSSFYIKIYANTPSLTNNVGDSIELLCQLFKNNERVTDWDTAAFALGNHQILSMTKQRPDSIGYHVIIRGVSEGSSSLTVTDTESGAFATINLSFGINAVSPYSYLVYDVPMIKYPDEPITNCYNVNGLYANNYKYMRNESNGYDVSFDVYNQRYMYGAVDVYNAEGEWIASEEIKKHTSITSIWDTGESLYFLISDTINGSIMSYTAHSVSTKTSVSITVPDGGYFTISNNFAESPGTFLYNEIDFLVLAVETAIDYGTEGIKTDDVVKYFKDQFFEDKSFTGTQLAKIFLKKFRSIAIKASSKAAEWGYGEVVNSSLVDFEDLIKSTGLGSIKDVIKTATGIAESVFEKMSGPPGLVLKALFSFAKLGDYFVQATQICNSTNKQYVCIHTVTFPPIQGVTVTTTDNTINESAILQVFRIDNGATTTAVVNQSDYYDQHETYNIRLIHDGNEVQPNGKTTVKLPVPDGFDKNACIVLRQEENGAWTIMNITVEGNYLVFETEHFSVYSVVTENTENAVVLEAAEENENISTKLYCKEDTRCMAYCAYYDSDGRMLSVETRELVAGIVNDCSFSTNSESTRAKVFILDEAGIPQCHYSFIAVNHTF